MESASPSAQNQKSQVDVSVERILAPDEEELSTVRVIQALNRMKSGGGRRVLGYGNL